MAAGASPLVAQMVKYAFDNTQGGEPMRVLLHTLVSGLIAKAQGGSVAGGAAGGFTAAMLGGNDALSNMMFGKAVGDLMEDQKELLANIATLPARWASVISRMRLITKLSMRGLASARVPVWGTVCG